VVLPAPRPPRGRLDLLQRRVGRGHREPLAPSVQVDPDMTRQSSFQAKGVQFDGRKYVTESPNPRRRHNPPHSRRTGCRSRCLLRRPLRPGARRGSAWDRKVVHVQKPGSEASPTLPLYRGQHQAPVGHRPLLFPLQPFVKRFLNRVRKLRAQT